MQPGQVVIDQDFKTQDGTVLPKFYVVLGVEDGFYINVRTTSRMGRRSNVPGCHLDTPHTFFVPRTSVPDCFREDTWIQLHEIYCMSLTTTLQSGMTGGSSLKGILPNDILKPLIICATYSEDITPVQIEVLNRTLRIL